MVWCDFTQLLLRIITWSIHAIRSDLNLLRHWFSWAALICFTRDYACQSCFWDVEVPQSACLDSRHDCKFLFGFCSPAILLHHVWCVATQWTAPVQSHILRLDFRMQCDVSCHVVWQFLTFSLHNKRKFISIRFECFASRLWHTVQASPGDCDRSLIQALVGFVWAGSFVWGRIVWVVWV